MGATTARRFRTWNPKAFSGEPAVNPNPDAQWGLPPKTTQM